MNEIKPLFSVLIPSWNNLPYLKICVNSILKNSAYHHQIIVHVNEGSDGTLEWVKDQGLTYTYTPENAGVCIAMNMMRTKVATDYMFFINDDMYVLPGWDVSLWNEIQSLPDNKFFLSGTMMQHSWKLDVSIPCDYGHTPGDFQEDRLLSEYMQYEKADWKGATWPPNIVHRDIWDIVGGYSIEFTPGMYSDPDFSAKLWLVGVRYMKGLGQCRVYHFETKSTTRIRKNDGSFQFLLKWGMTNSTFRRYISRLGKPIDQNDKSETNSKGFRWNRCRGKIKAIWKLVVDGLGSPFPLSSQS